MTIFGRQQYQYARDLSKVLALGMALGFASVSTARMAIPGNGTNNDFIYVQAPSLNSSQPYVYQPVITPNIIGDAQNNETGHLWPRMISYSMETDSVDAFVQSDMRIGMQYNYAFNFELAARNGQGRGMAIPEGWYQLQVAVIKKAGNGSRLKNTGNHIERYVTSNSMFLKVSNGSFGRKISLRFPDLTSTSLKHHLFVELIPLNEDCNYQGEQFKCIRLNGKGEPDAQSSVLEPRPGFKTYLVEMPFVPYQPSGGKVRDADDLSEQDQAFLGGSLAKFIARAQLHKNKKALQAQQNVSPADHARKNRLVLKSLDAPELANAAPAVKRLMDAKAYGVIQAGELKKSELINLCSQLIANNAHFQERHKKLPFARERESVIKGHIERCANDPHSYMRLNRVLHVGRPVPGKIERVAQKALTYTIMSNYMSSRSQSVDTVETVSWKAPGFIVQFTEQLGLGAARSVNFVNGRSRADTGIASMSTSLDFNYVVFNVPTVGSQPCLEVRPLPDTALFFFNPKDGANNGIYICGAKDNGVIDAPEIYAHAFERCKDTTMLECDSLTQSVNVSLRGERDLSAFFYAIRDGISPDHNNRIMPFGSVAGAERYFASVPLMDDMEVVNPVEFPHEKVPSFLKQISGQHREF